MFLRLDKETGEIQEWNPPFPVLNQEKNGYFVFGTRGYFLPYCPMGEDGEEEKTPAWDCRYFSAFDRKLYEVRLETGAYREVAVSFDVKGLRAHTSGFCEQSDWLQYACEENAFNSLGDFLDDNISGAAFDRERQLRDYRQIAANNDGTCGEKVHVFVKNKLEYK